MEDDDVSSLSSNDSIARKSCCKKRRTNDGGSLLVSRQSLPPSPHLEVRGNVYQKIIQEHSRLLNLGISSQLRDFYRTHNATDFVSVTRHWSKANPYLPAPQNPIGLYNYSMLSGIDDVVDYCDKFFNLLPDAMLSTRVMRSATKGDVTKVVCDLTFTGTLVKQIMLPASVAADPIKNMTATRAALLKADPFRDNFSNQRSRRSLQANEDLLKLSQSGRESL
jgi:hypothetical protein